MINVFSGYEKMPDSLKKLKFDTGDFSKINKLKWAVTEKVHGANFSFVYENNQLKFAKRREYLKWTDDFFGFQSVVHKLEDKILRLFERLSVEIDGGKYIIYGELFGGEYPHPDVKPVKGIQAIQTGVYYAPDIHFYAFDIAVGAKNGNGKYYLDYENAVSYFKQFDIFYAKPLSIGKFSEAANFNIGINSSLPKDFHLPELKTNLIEGVVIKPYNLIDKNIFPVRPIVKRKNPRFDEEEKFHNAEKWSFVPDVSCKTERLSFVANELGKYVTVNRLESAVSKTGALDIHNQSRISEIESEFLNDIFNDFNENSGNLLSDINNDDGAWLRERMTSAIRKMIISFVQRD